MRRLRLVCTIVALVAFSAVASSQTPSGHALFQQALAKERVEGNLPEAIKLYERVVAEFASDRALAARALVQVGQCYEKLGRDEAVKAYERLVRDFADQEDAVEQARMRLAALKRPAPGVTAAATTPTVRRLPRGNINEVLSLSPDGMKAAGLNYDTGQNLAVYDVASQRTTEVTNFDWTPNSSYALFAAWSSDGRRIAYAQCGNQASSVCELRVTTLAGDSNVVFRTEAGSLAAPAGWLPDGNALLVGLGRADKTTSIGLIPTAGGPYTQLRSINWTGAYPEPPSLSPDGRLIAFSEGSPGLRNIHVISRDGRTAHRIIDHPADDHRPLWSPDGRNLAFLSNRNGSVALWAVPIKDGQPAAEPMRIKDGMQNVSHLLGWTTRGLSYSEYLRTDDIYTVLVDRASGEPAGSPQLIAYRRTGRNVAPSWSPDGKYLAFVSSSPAEPDRRAVVLLPNGSGEPREFLIPTSLYRSVYAPSDLLWFGDSRGLGFRGFDARGEPTLFRLTVATGEWETFPLPVPFDGALIEWNADGSRYFYVRKRPGDDTAIVERDLQSDRERIVFRGNLSVDGLRFSPDRRLLAINRYTPEIKGNSRQQGIVVLEVETGQTRVVYDRTFEGASTFDSLAVTWSPDARALLVLRTERPGSDQQATDLRLIQIDGSEVRPIPLGPEVSRLLSSGRGAPRPTMRSVAWSPDGRRLGFVLTASQLESFVIENPLANVGSADGTARK